MSKQCSRGHEIAGDNILISEGRTRCRACCKLRAKRYRASKRALPDGAEPYSNTNPRPIPVMSQIDIDRFWSKVDRGREDDCWIWKDSKPGKGYGSFSLGGVDFPAHRIAYHLISGPIAPGLTIDHLCRNPSCVNPDHHEPVPMPTNTLRGESFAARHARKTHCPSGHPLSGDNLCLYKGRRYCRACMRRHKQNHAAKKKAERIGGQR